MEEPYYPRTLGEFVAIYARYAPRLKAHGPSLSICAPCRRSGCCCRTRRGCLRPAKLVALLRARSAGEGANLPSLVTLHALAPRELILRLAAADGRAARILLVPAGIDADQAGRLAAAAAVLPATAGRDAMAARHLGHDW
jgi:hypothetical protein